MEGKKIYILLRDSGENVKELLEEMQRTISEYDLINYNKNKKLIDFKEEIYSAIEDIHYILDLIKILKIGRNNDRQFENNN